MRRLYSLQAQDIIAFAEALLLACYVVFRANEITHYRIGKPIAEILPIFFVPKASLLAINSNIHADGRVDSDIAILGKALDDTGHFDNEVPQIRILDLLAARCLPAINLFCDAVVQIG